MTGRTRDMHCARFGAAKWRAGRSRRQADTSPMLGVLVACLIDPVQVLHFHQIVPSPSHIYVMHGRIILATPD